MSPSVPFDAVLFDLDGTLVATDRFWPQAARAGALRAFEELGLADRPLPTSADWMGMVGLPLAQGFDEVFADLEPAARAHVMRRCEEAEHEFLGRGHAACLPGVEETLAELHAAGVRLGIASNCGRDYLHAMMHGLGLSRWIEEGRCLDSPGIGDKADMVQDLLETFGTRRAVMVGDRVGDRDAAWANGLPHVHLARGYARSGEEVPCEARIDGFDELLPRLRRRTEVLEELTRRLGLFDPGVVELVVAGGPGSGKTLLVGELAACLEARGRPCLVLAPGAPVPGGDRLRLRVERPWASAGPEPGRVPGVRRLWLEAPQELLLRRIAGRDGRLAGPGPVRWAREEVLPGLEDLARRAGPWDAVLDVSNLLAPVLVAAAAPGA